MKDKINSCTRKVSFVFTNDKFYLTQLNNSKNIWRRNKRNCERMHDFSEKSCG